MLYWVSYLLISYLITAEMISQDRSKNFAPTNDATYAASNHPLVAHERKSIELKIIKDMISMYQESFSEKEKILEEEKQKLSELNYQVWLLKDSFCNQVWRFSCEYDFSLIFKYYPCETGHYMEWKNIYKDDIEHSQTLIDLINEIDFMKMEVHSQINNGKDLKRDMENALMNLKRLQTISDDAMELLSPSESSHILTTMPICNEVIANHSAKVGPHRNNTDLRNKNIQIPQNKSSLRSKSSLESGTSTNASNRKEITSISKRYPELPLERNDIFSKKTVITNVSTESTRSQRPENFALKKRSKISIRFEQDRKHK